MRTYLVEVDGEQLEGDADVAAEAERLEHVYDVVPVVDVLTTQLFQDADLLLRLPAHSSSCIDEIIIFSEYCTATKFHEICF